MFQTIQACRAAAAILVVFFHAGGTLAKEKYFGATASSIEQLFYFGGNAGVAFFFVLSGFIITYVHRTDFDRPEKLLTYLRKRVARIYPTYLIIFLGVYLLAISTPSLRDAMPSDSAILLKSLLLLPQDSGIVGGTGAPVLIVAWSLQYEVLFYAVFAIAIINRWAFYGLVAAFLINICWQLVSSPYVFPRSFFASHHILLFGMGMITSAIIKSRIYLSNSRLIAVCSVFAFFFIGMVSNIIRDSYLQPAIGLAYGSLSAILIFALTRYESENKNCIKSKLPSLLGDSSYALYLIHLPLISVLCKLAVLVLPKSAYGACGGFLLIVGSCILAGIIFHIFIERPLLRRLTFNAFSQRSEAVAART